MVFVVDIIEVVVSVVMLFGYCYLVVMMFDCMVLLIEDCLKFVGFDVCCVLVCVSGFVVFEFEVYLVCVIELIVG